jgi:thymidylate kinase/SAM-dependent methyltransferase
MSFRLSLLGIDGSGKSLVTAALADLVAGELGLTVALVGDDVRVNSPTEDRLRPGLAPDGQPVSARLALQLRLLAKRAAAHRRLYPPLKLAHLAMQASAARRLEASYRPDVIVSDGHLLLSAAGRAVNYLAGSGAEGVDPVDQVERVYQHVMGEAPLPPDDAWAALPGLRLMRWLRRLDEWASLGLFRLPDAVLLLDVAPEVALARLRLSGRPMDGHETLEALTQARRMYQAAAEFFRRRQGRPRAEVLDVTALSVGEALRAALAFVRSRLCAHPAPLIPTPIPSAPSGHLGRSRAALGSPTAVVRHVVSHRYLARYLLPQIGQGSLRELAFPLSALGRQMLREGYSADVMRAIYQRSERPQPLADRLFLGYGLHRAVYHRLGIVTDLVQREVQARLSGMADGEAARILSAPSGYALDLLRPLRELARSSAARPGSLCVLASDLDPDGRIEPEVGRALTGLGVRFRFLRGDLTGPDVRAEFCRRGPFDLIVFVGLSSWIPKAHLLRHLRLAARLLAPGGLLISDCFTAHAFALSGHYAGFAASYYTPRDYASLLAYCGFPSDGIAWSSGPEGINHVGAARVGQRP